MEPGGHGVVLRYQSHPFSHFLSSLSDDRHHSAQPGPPGNMNNSTSSMPMGTNTSSTSMDMMTPWLHFGNTDYLIFKTWRPSSHGAIAGACIGLFAFCILERGLAAYRRAQELRWMAKSACH